MATAIMKQKEVPEMDDVEKVISKISEESKQPVPRQDTPETHIVKTVVRSYLLVK